MWLKFDCAAKQLENPIKRTKKSSKPPCALQAGLIPRRPQVCQEKVVECFCSILRDDTSWEDQVLLVLPSEHQVSPPSAPDGRECSHQICSILVKHYICQNVCTASQKKNCCTEDVLIMKWYHIHHSTVLLTTFAKTTNRIILKILFRKKSTCGDHRPAPEQVLIMENVYDT